jgi:hypothetical protein
VYPAQPGRAGYLEVWCYPHGAEDMTVLFGVPGAPALPWGEDTLHALLRGRVRDSSPWMRVQGASAQA